jgi:MarR family 2-MHQ and catechol resistance regulon transcriptional repressor
MASGTHIRLILGKASKAIEKFDGESIAQTGLGLSDFTIMEAFLHKGPLPINTIGKKVLLTSGSMTAAVNPLERRGLVKRVQNSSDGRTIIPGLNDSHTHVIRGGLNYNRSHHSGGQCRIRG